MNRKVTSEEFYQKIGPLNVRLEVKEPKNPAPCMLCGLGYPYTTLFILKDGGKLVGFEKAGTYFLCEEETEYE